MRKMIMCGWVLLAAVSSARAAAVDEALDALHDRGVTLKSLAADVSIKTIDDLGNDRTKSGKFVMQRLPDGDTRVRATFTKTESAGMTVDERRDYLLAGTDLVERDYTATPKKKQTTRQVRQPGEKVDLFKLGQGPFPLPIGQSRADVLRDFDVTERPVKDAAVLAELVLKPKMDTAMAEKFRSITVRVDLEKRLPTTITTVSRNATETNVVTLTNLRVDGEVKDEEFKLEPIDAKDWNFVGTK